MIFLLQWRKNSHKYTNNNNQLLLLLLSLLWLLLLLLLFIFVIIIAAKEQCFRFAQQNKQGLSLLLLLQTNNDLGLHNQTNRVFFVVVTAEKQCFRG